MADEGDEFSGASIGNVAGMMARAIAEGRSANETFRASQEAGMGMRRQTFLRTFGQVAAALESRTAAVAADLGSLPNPELVQDWNMRKQGISATQLLVFQRDKETGEVGATNYTYMTQGPHTPQDAIDAMMADFLPESEPDGAYAEYQVIGAVPWGFYQSVPMA